VNEQRSPLTPEVRRGVKWGRFPDDVLCAWVADMDLGTAPAVVDRLRRLVDRSDFGYQPDPTAAIVDAFVGWQQRRHGWTPPPERVRVFIDVLQGIAASLRWGTARGSGVVLLTPIYPPFLAAVAHAERRLLDVPLTGPDRRLDTQRLEAAVDAGAGALLLCNPHNPTGRVFDAEELAAIAEVAVRRDLLVISDEIWGDVVHPGSTHVPLAGLGDEVAARTVTLTSASKAFNLAGLRCAVGVIGPDGLRRRLDGLPPHLLGESNAFGATALVAAWTEGEAWLDETRRTLTARRDQLGGLLAELLPTVGYAPPEATYLAWLDLRPLGMGDDPTTRLLADGRIALSPGPDFGPGGAGHARLNFATTPELLAEAVRRIAIAAATGG
jgi:cysteine-S-conjugate beta-lyase